jgi:NRPS condensation-like uncharacterized protein
MTHIAENRKLGRLEKTMEILNSRAKTWNIVTISRIKGNLEEKVLRQSLNILQSRHPRLNSHINHFRNNLYFQTSGTHQINLQVLEKLNSQQWEEVVNEEMNQAIESNKCLMRVVLVHILNEENIHYLITTIHHAIADALSSIQLHSEILTYCHKIIAGEPIQAITSSPLLPPIENLLPVWTRTWRGKINSLVLLIKLGLQKILYQPKTLALTKYVSIPQRSCQIIHKQIEPKITQDFIQKCRQNNITVHCALCALLMLVIAKKVSKYDQENMIISCLTYPDLRKHLQPEISQQILAVLATSLLGFYRLNTNTPFWELARKVKQDINNSIHNGDIFRMVLLAKELIDFCFIFPKQVAATVSVSNIGKVNIPSNYGELMLEEISFAGSHSLYAGMFVMHTTTFQEKMLLNFAFSHPSISYQTMEKLIKDVLDGIIQISSHQFPNISNKR